MSPTRSRLLTPTDWLQPGDLLRLERPPITYTALVVATRVQEPIKLKRFWSETVCSDEQHQVLVLMLEMTNLLKASTTLSEEESFWIRQDHVVSGWEGAILLRRGR